MATVAPRRTARTLAVACPVMLALAVAATMLACKRDRGATAPARDTYSVARASTPVTIDGKADDKAWQQAFWSPAFAPTEGGLRLAHRTRAKLLYDDSFLYALIDVEDPDVFSPYTKRDDSLWKADVVELFIDADRSGAGYVELQVNPNNAQFDAWFAHTRREGLDKAWNAAMRSAVAVRGTTDDRSDKDQGWTAEIAVPLAAVKGRDDAMAVSIPPSPGDTWRLNIVRIEMAVGALQIAASSWNPIPIQDFHALDRMLTITFEPAL